MIVTKSVVQELIGSITLLALLMACTPSTGARQPTSVDFKQPIPVQEGASFNTSTSLISAGSDTLPRLRALTSIFKNSLGSSSQATPHSKRDQSAQTESKSRMTTTVSGGILNDSLICTEVAPDLTSDPITTHITCTGGTHYNGGFTGHTIVKLEATMDVDGNFRGTFDDWFYGVYTADNTVGELYFKGKFSIIGNQFLAEANIVDGTCGFAGSTGTLTADGNSLYGGYTAQWIRPETPVAPDPTCNPLDPNSLP